MITAEETMLLERIYLTTNDGCRKNLHKVYLLRDGKRACTLKQYITQLFDRITPIHDELVRLTKKRVGQYAWQLVSFEGIGLYYALQDGFLLEKEIEK